MPRTEVYTLKHPDLLAVQDAMVRRIVEALKDFDNLYYEICNEPYFGGVTEDWQAHIAETIAAAEAGFEHKHLIAQNIANNTKKIENPNPRVSIFNFHYAKPPVAVAENYQLNKVIGDDETGFAGDDRVKPYRLEGWDFILAGGAVYSNLDYSFAVGHEDGSNKINAPGGGGPELHKQLRILKDFIHQFDFVRMKPDDSVVKSALPKDVTVRVLSEPGQAYAGLRERRRPDGACPRSAAGPVRGRMGEHQDRPNRQGRALPARRRRPDAPGPRRTSMTSPCGSSGSCRPAERASPAVQQRFRAAGISGLAKLGQSADRRRDPTRAGRKVMKTSLDRYKDRYPDRTEIQGPPAEIGKEYWYGFSILLPEDYVPDRIWEIVAQWQGRAGHRSSARSGETRCWPCPRPTGGGAG